MINLPTNTIDHQVKINILEIRFQMGYTYLRIYKSKSERIQRGKITQEKILKKRERL